MAPYFFMLTKKSNALQFTLGRIGTIPLSIGINNIGTDLQAVFLPLS